MEEHHMDGTQHQKYEEVLLKKNEIFGLEGEEDSKHSQKTT